jgi:RNA polymerase sigma-70 factor (ECF subfamily)
MTADAQADLVLLQRIAARDVHAVTDLYDRHSGALYSLIHRILRDPAEAEDVLQEVFLRVWERAESYDSALGAPMAWLVRIARNRSIDRVRARSAGPSTEPPDAAMDERLLDAASTAPTPERLTSMSEDQRALAGALMRLAPEQRMLIEQTFFMGYTQSELAAKFNLPLGTVKTRIRKGMQAMREHLQQCSDGDDRARRTCGARCRRRAD